MGVDPLLAPPAGMGKPEQLQSLDILATAGAAEMAIMYQNAMRGSTQALQQQQDPQQMQLQQQQQLVPGLAAAATAGTAQLSEAPAGAELTPPGQEVDESGAHLSEEKRSRTGRLIRPTEKASTVDDMSGLDEEQKTVEAAQALAQAQAQAPSAAGASAQMQTSILQVRLPHASTVLAHKATLDLGNNFTPK